MENYIFKTRILTLAQYIEEASLGDLTENFEGTIKYLLENFGAVAEHYAYTVMYDKKYGDFIGRSFCPITNTHTDAIMYTINTLIETYH